MPSLEHFAKLQIQKQFERSLKLVHYKQLIFLPVSACSTLVCTNKATLIKSMKDKPGMGIYNIKLLSKNRWVCFIRFERTQIRGIHVLLWRKWKQNRGSDMKRKPWGKNGRIAQKRGWMNNTQRRPHKSEEMREKFWEKWESIHNFIRKIRIIKVLWKT